MRYFLAAAVILMISGCASMKVRHSDGDMIMSFKKEAERIILYSSATGYTPIDAEKAGDWWHVSIKDTDKLKYFLKADGEIFLPDCKYKENDDFGGELCIYKR